ncbi:uncharacterized protein si:ch211-191i18.2 isoform X2 [Lates calcarifer]|uniref:Uncharacterized protein si:ch211-191i18.2 isoform X2 n=1 Tax=Lates calcarifer TaxID=8187 RepID=A0AAJ8B3D5_LATCA|nr:uncharacterized protein si:ch211-191i18.2 isoform X2 [Lates calcarifer]
MSSLSFLSVYLSGASVILLLTAAASQAQDYDFTPPTDYDSDYNATFEYSFYSNTSSEDLEKFSERFIDQEGEEDATVTMTTTQGPTEKGGAKVNNAASLPVSLLLLGVFDATETSEGHLT